ncbi:MAG: sodium/solute symporter [Verrucomicrobiota bacterium]
MDQTQASLAKRVLMMVRSIFPQFLLPVSLIRCAIALVGAGLLSANARSATNQSALLQWTRLPDLPNALGLAGPFAGISQGVLVVAGGANFPNSFPWEGGAKVWHDTVYVLRTADGAWEAAGKLPRALGYGVSATTSSGVVCAGGSDAQRHYQQVFRLEWSNGAIQISSLPDLPRACANACGAIIGDTLFIAGGEETPGATNALHTFWSLDLADPRARWNERPPWPGPGRTLATSAVQAGAFFIIGGVSLSAGDGGKPKRTYLADGYRFDPNLKTWRRIADLPHPMAAAPSPAPAVGQSHFFLLGGDDGRQFGFEPMREHAGFTRRVLAYHLITDTWCEMGETPGGQVTVPMVAWEGRFIVPSGEIRPGVRTPAIHSMRLAHRKAGFGWVNYATVGLYLAAMVWLGGSFVKKNRSTNDFFRGGQRIPWWAAGVSIFATMLSSITFMAIPAQAYSVGWNLFLANSYLLITPLVTWVFLPFYRKLNVTSAYEYLEKRFNLASRLMASALFILYQCGRVAVVLFLPSLALATVSNIDVLTSVLVMGLLCVIYTVLGGIEAVIWTDFIQTIILLGGAIWALASIVGQLHGGVGDWMTEISRQGKFFETVNWNFDIVVATGWTIMLGNIFNHLFSYTASQDIVQRYVTTPDRQTAARAIWTNALMAAPAQAIFFAIGTALFLFYRQNPDRLDPMVQTDGIFPLFIVNEMPIGVAGLIVAGIFAAAQSTLAGSLNSIATVWVTDFHRRLKPQTSDAACLKLARWITAIVGMLATGMAVVLAKADIRSLWETFLAVLGLFGGTISGLFLLGVFSRRAHGRGAMAGALASAALVGLIYFYKLTSIWLYSLVGVLSCVLLGWLASRLLPGPRMAPDGLTIHTLERER